MGEASSSYRDWIHSLATFAAEMHSAPHEAIMDAYSYAHVQQLI